MTSPLPDIRDQVSAIGMDSNTSSRKRRADTAKLVGEESSKKGLKVDETSVEQGRQSDSQHFSQITYPAAVTIPHQPNPPTNTSNSTTNSIQDPQASPLPICLDPWSIVGYRLCHLTRLNNICPMSLTYINCNIPECPFDHHLCPTFARRGKCANGARVCNDAHVKPSCIDHVQDNNCAPIPSSNHLRVRSHKGAVDFEERVTLEKVRLWLETQGFGDHNGPF